MSKNQFILKCCNRFQCLSLIEEDTEDTSKIPTQEYKVCTYGMFVVRWENGYLTRIFTEQNKIHEEVISATENIETYYKKPFGAPISIELESVHFRKRA